MLEFRTEGFHGYAVKYSPFFDNRIAVAASANYGLVGNGRLFILELTPQGIVPLKMYAGNIARVNLPHLTTCAVIPLKTPCTMSLIPKPIPHTSLFPRAMAPSASTTPPLPPNSRLQPTKSILEKCFPVLGILRQKQHLPPRPGTVRSRYGTRNDSKVY